MGGDCQMVGRRVPALWYVAPAGGTATQRPRARAIGARYPSAGLLRSLMPTPAGAFNHLRSSRSKSGFTRLLLIGLRWRCYTSTYLSAVRYGVSAIATGAIALSLVRRASLWLMYGR